MHYRMAVASIHLHNAVLNIAILAVFQTSLLHVFFKIYFHIQYEIGRDPVSSFIDNPFFPTDLVCHLHHILNSYVCMGKFRTLF